MKEYLINLAIPLTIGFLAGILGMVGILGINYAFPSQISEEDYRKAYNQGWNERGAMLEIRADKHSDSLRSDCELFRSGTFQEIIIQDGLVATYCMFTK